MTASRTIAVLIIAALTGACGSRPRPEGPPLDVRVLAPPDPQRFCPPDPPQTFEIPRADPKADKTQHDQVRADLVTWVTQANATILLGPNVVIDFTGAGDDLVPLEIGPCVTIQGTRSPNSLGALLKFGPHRSDQEKIFLSVSCSAGDDTPSDHVRITGFRIHGPSFGQQEHDDLGIHIRRCLDVEVSNMEVAGWGGVGIHVVDEGNADNQPEEGPGQVPPHNAPGERIGQPSQIRIFGNYVHHNQHPRTTWNSHTAGYGVEVDHGAWAQVFENVFDFNRHAIAAAGDTGGYEAVRNLVLKGGGLHYGFLGIHTHQFDIHGTGGSGKGGQAGVKFLYATNSFQYRRDNAIYVRGTPQKMVDIVDNIFPHPGFEDDWGDDAVKLQDRDDIGVTINLGSGNVIEYDSYGKYGVCDFDGDGVDDVFLATGKTWWYSSFGEFQWTYLTARTERINQVRLGYFDNDNRCDVLTESGREWVIASGGTGAWQSIGAFGAPLSEVAFGRFDPNIRDHRPGATKRTTHAFRRMPDGEWRVTPLSAPDWQHAQSSTIPMNRLRFGDLTGDGVTDVLAVQGGRWSISESARGTWKQLNPHLSNDVRPLLMADLNHNNIEDLIRLERVTVPLPTGQVWERVTWWISDDGRTRWRKLKTYTFTSLLGSPPLVPLAGRFGAAPGGGVLLVDHDRFGWFHSPAEVAAGASADWRSLFTY